MSKEFEELTDEAIANIRKDRQQTQELLKDLVKYLAEDNHRHKEVGLTAAKYVSQSRSSRLNPTSLASFLDLIPTIFTSCSLDL